MDSVDDPLKPNIRLLVKLSIIISGAIAMSDSLAEQGIDQYADLEVQEWLRDFERKAYGNRF